MRVIPEVTHTLSGQAARVEWGREEAEPVVVLGIAGSLRSGSLTRGLLRAAQSSTPSGVGVRLADLAQIPLFNEDVEALGDPQPVRRLKEQMRVADALLIATPEYNSSIPGVLKNALDWASRPPRQSALAGKLVALIGVSPGPSGAAGSLAELRRVLARTHSLVLAEPLSLPNAATLFDGSGALIDEMTRQHVHTLLATLAARVRPARPIQASTVAASA